MWFSKKAKEKAPSGYQPGRAHTITTGDKPLGGQLGRTKFRRGMWVVYSESVGIATGQQLMDGAVYLKIDVVDKQEGTTLMEINVPMDAVRQATHNEIPPARRPSEQRSKRLGYLS